jgi:hypothetical protein
MYSQSGMMSDFAFNDSDKLDPLMIAMLHVSNSSPFFVRDQECGRLKLTNSLIDTWWFYLPIIVTESSADASTSFCLKALHSLWGYLSPYIYDNQTRQWIDCHKPEGWARNLSRKAIAGKLWLAGDDCESKRCLHMLYCSIRDALVYASPYRLFPDSYKQTRRAGERKDKYRSDIINAIAEMLRYERRISMYEGRPTLTDCAIKWRCLDIWKLALGKAECQPLSSEIWNDYSHLYDSVGFVSCESGTSVCLTRDSSSKKVILAIDERQYRELNDWAFGTIKQQYPRDPAIKKLTKHWPCIVKLPQAHCEVYPSKPIQSDSGNDEQEQRYSNKDAYSTSPYKLWPMDDGGIELFIDCCEIDEPWERICAEVRREQGFDSDDSTDDSCSEGSADEDRNSEDNEEESGEVSTGLFSKIAGVGKDVLSAFV